MNHHSYFTITVPLVPNVPIILSVERFSFVVSWTKLTLEQQNGPLMGYNIRWVSEGRQDSTTVGDVNTFNVSSNIQPNTQYNVSVSAINTGSGQGPFSQPAIVMTVQDGK